TARRRWLTAAAGVAAAAVVAVAVTVLPGHDTPAAVASGTPPMLAYPVGPEAVASGEGEPARDTLLALAAAASEQDAPDPAGDVQHTLSQNYWASTTVDGTESSTTIDPVVSETWVRPDGSSVNLEWRGDPLLADGALEAVSTAPQDAVVDRIPAGTFDAGQVADLPRDPAALRAALLAPYAHLGCGPDGDPAAGPWCVYFAVTGIADFLVLPPDLEAAIWRVLADEPGLTLAGTVEDRAGHESVAVSVPASPGDVDPTVRMLLVDRSTGRLSGREEITLSSEVMQITEPTVTNFRYTLASDWVAEVGGPPEE
ncbi:CU044_5270 family protein, partial [Cellulomonas triticagri]